MYWRPGPQKAAPIRRTIQRDVPQLVSGQLKMGCAFQRGSVNRFQSEVHFGDMYRRPSPQKAAPIHSTVQRNVPQLVSGQVEYSEIIGS